MKKENKTKTTKGVSLKTIGILVTSFTLMISSLLVGSLYLLSNKYQQVNDSTQKYMRWENVAHDVQSASDYLTTEVRSFVVTAEKSHMDNYFEESHVTKRRENALAVIKENLEGTDIYLNVTAAINESMDLMNQEYHAMRLVSEVKGVDYSDYPEIVNFTLSAEDLALSNEEKLEKSISLVHGIKYENKKKIISNNINKAVSTLEQLMRDDVVKASNSLKKILIAQQILIGVNVVFLFGLVIMIYFTFMKPLRAAYNSIELDEKVIPHGVKEFAYVAESYNKTHTLNENIKERLVYEAEHDTLTRLYNRTGYDSIYKRINLENAVYILIDADNFKEINDKHGHSVGDKILAKIAKTLTKYFGDDVDSFIFRIGGDEFSIVIENYPYDNDDLLIRKLNRMNDELSKKDGVLPAISLSIGIAHGKSADTTDSLFKKADKALYQVKKQGRHGVAVDK